MMACRTGCPTPGAHATWGACARAAELQIDTHSLKNDSRVEKDKNHRLDEYASLRKHGVQPKSTTWRHVRDAAENGGTAPTPVAQAPVEGAA